MRPFWRIAKNALLSLCILVLLVGGGLLLAPYLSGHAFAASEVTCRQQPDADHCENRDPAHQQCVTTETTTLSADITDATTGKIVGRVDRRFSPLCHTWWGRVFDYRALPGGSLHLQVGTTSYSLPFGAVAYSDMVFDASPHTPAPAVTGTLVMANGKPDPMLSATIPAA